MKPDQTEWYGLPVRPDPKIPVGTVRVETPWYFREGQPRVFTAMAQPDLGRKLNHA